ncbi:MAG: hypothetical protein FJ316_12350 [SAR202 cluster bacterium]|nr:hypothetical protein [SAR202 cluster bacterium]
MIFSIAGTAVLSGLSVMHDTGALVDEHSVAENLARNQMEYVFKQTYQDAPATYSSIPTENGYAVVAVAQEYEVGNPDIQRVVVTASRDDDTILTLETLRGR